MSLTQAGAGGTLSSIAFGATAAVSLVALFLPDSPEVGWEVPGLDKVIHLLLFGLLSVTARWRFGAPRGLAPALLLYAAGSELVQALLLPGRSGDLLDLAADVGGAAAGLVVADAWLRAHPGSVADDIRS